MKGRALAQQTTTQSGGSGDPSGGCTVLEPGDPAEVGMSAERLVYRSCSKNVTVNPGEALKGE